MCDDPNTLLARLLIRDPRDPQELVRWAGLALEHGDDSRSLRMLAECDPRSDLDDIEELFRKSRSELGIDELSQRKLVRCFATSLCAGIANGTIPCRSGLCNLMEIREEVPELVPELDCLTPLVKKLELLEGALSEVVDDPEGLHFAPGPNDWDPEGVQIDRRDAPFVLSMVLAPDEDTWRAASKVGLGRFEQEIRDAIASVQLSPENRAT